jgi:hypothetical protein
MAGGSPRNAARIHETADEVQPASGPIFDGLAKVKKYDFCEVLRFKI